MVTNVRYILLVIVLYKELQLLKPNNMDTSWLRELDITTITSENYSLSVTSEGGAVVEWYTTEQGKRIDILYLGSQLKRSGNPILFPFANPLENNIFTPSQKEIPAHGFGRRVQWEVSKTQENQVILSINSDSLPEEWKQAYPYMFRFSIIIKLQQNCLVYTMKMENNDTKDIPIAPGVHPYFPMKHMKKHTLRIPQLMFTGSELNWDRPMEGNFYPFPMMIAAEFPNYTINISADSLYFRHLVLWSQVHTEPDHDFMCVELFSRESNEINTDPIIVPSGATWEEAISYEYTKK